VYAPVREQGIYRSADGGGTWSRIDDGLAGNLRFTNIAIDPSDSRRLFVGVQAASRDGEWVHGGVWRSTDRGRHWERVADIRERPRVVIAPSDTSTIYVAERDYSSVGRGGVYRSTDGGDTWELMVERLDEGRGNVARTYIGALAVDPRDASVVYASSVDEGYDLNCGKGVFVSRDGGESWQSMNEGLTQLNVHNLVIDPNDPDRLYAGTGGNGFFRWGPRPHPASLPRAPASPLPPNPACTTAKGWHCTAEKLHAITLQPDGPRPGHGFVLARIDTEKSGCHLVKAFEQPLDITRSRVVVLRLRGVKADGTPLCISRMCLYDTGGRALVYERDIQVHTTWVLVELALRDWEADEFERGAVGRLDFEFWVPYPGARPYEFGVAEVSFRE